MKCLQDHNCAEIISKVMLILDGRLTIEEEKEFLVEVEKCPFCLEKYDIEKSFKDFLIHKISQKKVPTSLVQNIKDKIDQMPLD